MPSLYICIFVIIIGCTILVLLNSSFDKPLYYISLCLLTVFLCLRFGQGADYPSYWSIYQQAEKALDPSIGFMEFNRTTHSEIGWKCLMVLFQALNTDYRIVVILVSLAMMWCTHKCIKTYCMRYRTLALVLLYPTIYLTYYFSGLRQGLAMAIFYGVLLGLLLKKKYIAYVVGVLLISMIHKVSLVYLIVPVIRYLNDKKLLIGLFVSGFFALCMWWRPVRGLIIFLASHFGHAEKYLSVVTFSMFSLLERLVMLGIIVFLYIRYKKRTDKSNEVIEVLMKIYFTSFLIYLCLSWSALTASRIAILFKMAEFILVPLLIEKEIKIMRHGTLVLLCCITALMTYKNLDSYSLNYKDGIKGWNYPYVTIFECEEILDYREGFIKEKYGFVEEYFIKNNIY